MAKKVLLIGLIVPMLFSCSVLFNVTHGIVINPTNYDFGDLDVNETKRFDVEVSNGTGKILNVAVIEIQGTNSDEFSIIAGGNVPTSIAANGKYTITVEFAPISAGNKEAFLHIEHDGENSPLECTFTGNGILVSGYSINPTSYDYGDVGVGAPVDTTFEISNVGNVNLTLSALEIIDDTEGNFAITSGEITGILEITPGNTHTFTATFTPVTEGLKTAKISVTHDAEGSPNITDIQGTGVIDVALSPSSHDFGTLEIGLTSNPYIFTATNPTASDVDLTDISFIGPDAAAFGLTLPPAPWFIPANGGSFIIETTFTPVSDLLHTAQLQVTHPNGVLLADVSGTGSASPIFSIDPQTHDFGSIEVLGTAVQDFTVSNTGTGLLDITNIELINDAEGNFTIISGGSAVGLNPGETHVIQVQFSPLTEGTKSATLSIEHNANGSPFLGDLSGLGATVIMLPVTKDFGNVVLGTTPPPSEIFTVENATSGPITITEIAITGPNSADFKATPTGTGSWDVAPSGGTFTITVTCEPTVVGVLSATLQVTHSAGILQSTLNATGIASPDFSINPTTYSFGTVTLGNSASTDFVVSNTGNGTLTITRIVIQNNPGNYTITAGGTGAGNIDVAPGGSHTITIQYRPLTFGAHNSNLRIDHNDSPDSPFNGALRGNAVGPDFRIIPNVTAHNFGDQYVNKTKRKAFYIKNAGNQNLVLSAVSLSTGSQYTKSHASLPITIIPGNIAVINVDFTPTSIGNKPDTLNITHNSVNSPKTVTLAGNGIAAAADFIENFDGGSAPRGWGATGDWQWGRPTTRGPSSAHSGRNCYATRLNNYYRANQNCYLVTPVIDLSAAVAPKLEFYHWLYTYYYDGGWMEYSTDGGSTWSRNVNPSPSYNGSVNGTSAYYGRTTTGWEKVEVDLSAAAGHSQVMFAWYFYSNSSWQLYGWHIDSVRIYDSGQTIPYNPTPVDNDINVKVSGNSFNLKWDCDFATTYDVYFGTTNPPTSLVASGLRTKEYQATVTNVGKYFWKVVARTSGGSKTGPVWYFECKSTMPKVLINEIDTIASDDWVEIYNVESYPVSISGWQLSEYSQNRNNPDGVYEFPEYTVLNPGQIVVVHDNQGGNVAFKSDFNYELANSTTPGEVILQGPKNYATGVDYVKFNTLYSHKPADLNWTGNLTSSNTGWSNLYRNSGTDTDSAANWRFRHRTADQGLKNPGQ